MTESEIRNLNQIVRHATLAMSYCKDIASAEELENAQQTADACVFNLIQIGEIAKMSLNDETKELIPNVPWPRVQSLRNKIVHDYEGINFEIIFETIKENLPVLVAGIESILNN